MADLAAAAQERGFAIMLDSNDQSRLQAACRRVHDWRVGWTNDSIPLAELEKHAFTWGTPPRTGTVHDGLVAFDQHLQKHNTNKRLVAAETNADYYASFLVPASRANDLIAAFKHHNVTAYLQDKEWN